MSYWARAPMAREQLVLIATTLDDRIPDDHAVRLVAEILEGYDWGSWESQYHGRMGQPPIHPKILAGLWLYGLRRGVRSSRKLEYMAKHSIDFMWLANGHTPDHTTLSEFRSKYESELKKLFRHILRVAMVGGFLQLIETGTDGTRIKANSSRFETWTAERIATALDELTAELEKQLAESQQTDHGEQGSGAESAEKLPPELADLKDRRKKLEEIQARLKDADEARRKDGIDPKKNPAQIPKHDPDSRVLPNKEGGYAPNYTPLATTEGHAGYIVDCEVVVGPSEHQELLPSLNRIVETLGEPPERALADGAFATGANIHSLEAQGIDFYSHVVTPCPEAENPAIRPDPTQPVPETDWDRLPINSQTKKFDKSCFTYAAEPDVYYCPRGEPMKYAETKTENKNGETIGWRIYRCGACATCRLAGRCVSATNKKGGRTISRDIYAADRERFAAKMQTPEAQTVYDRRMKIAETTFAIIKHVRGLRQFLLRGLKKVKLEWLWTCTAFNLDKLIRDVLRARAQFVAEGAVSAID